MPDQKTMPDNAKAGDNFERLLKHLQADSLAARLVEAHHAANAGYRLNSMTAALKSYLEQVKNVIENTKA